jgi:uncharacterized protein YfaQ (DUF2300 family)
MMTREETELARAVRDFQAALNSVPRTGVSWIAELAQLKILIGKYPDHARLILRQQARTSTESAPLDHTTSRRE